MQDFLKSKHTIKSINYDNGLRKSIDYEEFFKLGEIYEIPEFSKPVQTLTIDFGDCEFEIVGHVTWKTKEKSL